MTRARFRRRKIARSYALDRTVASVAITPIAGTRFDPAAATAARAPGSMTPLIDSCREIPRLIVGIASAVAVLHAITTCFGFIGSRNRTICRTNRQTAAGDLFP